MREIKFRGMSLDSGKWLYGRLKDMNEIVDAKTISQYTGLKDREGREIYEGDILEFERMPGKNAHGYVAYCDEKARYVVRFQREKYERTLSLVCALYKAFIIGNVHDNPEMWKWEADDGQA